MNISENYLKSGFIINKINKTKELHYLTNFIKSNIVSFLNFKKKETLDLNKLHKYIGKDLNKLRLFLINKLNKDLKFKDYLFEIAKSEIFEIVGNELAIQKNINLSIQCPNDDSSLLPIHSDTWAGNSPFESVLWLPFVDCSKSKSMFILNAKNYSKFEKVYKKKEVKSANDLYSNLKPHIEFVKIKHGEFMLFNQNLPHGNIVNKSNETRISLNCRFKSLFTPYRQKELGSFFKPLIIRPASKIGLKYKFPKK
jgi:sporadic carbohydrate cluster 2OG-Fe(II) oxygenase|tara:strand:+ start:3897 stop:4658 length:762 start_codon:yes stop_codon:yes gene_type:complete